MIPMKQIPSQKENVPEGMEPHFSAVYSGIIYRLPVSNNYVTSRKPNHEISSRLPHE